MLIVENDGDSNKFKDTNIKIIRINISPAKIIQTYCYNIEYMLQEYQHFTTKLKLSVIENHFTSD